MATAASILSKIKSNKIEINRTNIIIFSALIYT